MKVCTTLPKVTWSKRGSCECGAERTLLTWPLRLTSTTYCARCGVFGKRERYFETSAGVDPLAPGPGVDAAKHGRPRIAVANAAASTSGRVRAMRRLYPAGRGCPQGPPNLGRRETSSLYTRAGQPRAAVGVQRSTAGGQRRERPRAPGERHRREIGAHPRGLRKLRARRHALRCQLHVHQRRRPRSRPATESLHVRGCEQSPPYGHRFGQHGAGRTVPQLRRLAEKG